jgi:ferredoxin-NADP reductase
MWHVGTVVALHDETATARTIALEVSDWLGHVAGQHVDVRLTAPDGYSAGRSYSIASAPSSDGLTVERLPEGEVSSYLTQELAIGRSPGVARPNRRLVRLAQRTD